MLISVKFIKLYILIKKYNIIAGINFFLSDLIAKNDNQKKETIKKTSFDDRFLVIGKNIVSNRKYEEKNKTKE